MGTPQFAIPSLLLLLSSNQHQVKAVFTQTPKPQGRGMKIVKSPVHQLAESFDVPVYTPLSLKKPEMKELIDSIEADVIIVAAYGFIIPKPILEAKKYGCLNIHPSRLPRYRGAAPLQRTIINGDTETSICIMQMDEGLDTGDILLQKDFSLRPKITLTELDGICAAFGAEMLLEVLADIDKFPRVKQSDEGIVYAHKIAKEEGKINWGDSAFAIDCKIRAINTYFEFQEKRIKIIEANFSEQQHKFQAGHIIRLNKNSVEVACGKGILQIEKLQPEGKRVMSAADFFRGVKQGIHLL